VRKCGERKSRTNGRGRSRTVITKNGHKQSFAVQTCLLAWPRIDILFVTVIIKMRSALGKHITAFRWPLCVMACLKTRSGPNGRSPMPWRIVGPHCTHSLLFLPHLGTHTHNTHTPSLSRSLVRCTCFYTSASSGDTMYDPIAPTKDRRSGIS
jgi:hypothetical protein